MDKDKKIKGKTENRNNIVSEELIEVVIDIMKQVIASCIFSYIGYSFCLDNNYNLAKGIAYGALLPFIFRFIYVSIIDRMNLGILGTLITYFISLMIFIELVDNVPAICGVVVIFCIIGYYIYKIIKVKPYNTKTSKNQVEGIKNKNKPLKELENYRFENELYYGTETNLSDKSAYDDNLYSTFDDEDFNSDFEKEEFFCERCYKEISEDEFDEYGGMCEDCFVEAFDEKMME